MTYRVIAQDIRSGEFLNWNVPVSGLSVDYALSGPGVLSGTIAPEILTLNLALLDSWATWLHVEQDGRIAASGVLQPTSLDKSQVSLQCEGPSGYAHGIPYLGDMSEIGIDPLDVVRRIWAHIQGYPDGNIGLQLGATKTTQKLGTVAKPVAFTTTTGSNVGFDAGGPYTLSWWDHKDCGDEINSLAKATPFDYVERSVWNADKTNVEHYLDFGYPRLGRFRDDLRFAEGENILTSVPLVEVTDAYASTAITLGAGTGRTMIRGSATNSPDPRKLRRVAVITDKLMTSILRAEAESRAELRRRAADVSMQSITVDAAHRNAKLGTFSVGDDIAVTGNFPWIGRKTINHRITGYTWTPGSNQVAIKLAPSASFNYGPPPSG